MRTFYLLLFLFASKISVAQTKVGVVNSKKVLEALPYRDSMIRVIQQIEKEGIEELTSIDSMLRPQPRCIGYNGAPNLSEAARTAEIKKKQELQLRFQIREKEIDSALMAIGNELSITSLKMIKAAYELVAVSIGIDVIVDESVMLYYEDQIDITQQVIDQILKPAK